jgi:hypothetical protein
MLLVVLSVSFARGDDGSSLCDTNRLPPAIRNRIKKDLVLWKIQQPADLSASARKRWHPETPLTCPGIAVGHIRSAAHNTYVLLLVSESGTDQGYKLIAFGPSDDDARAYDPQIIEQSDKGGSSHNFIHAIQIDKVFSPEWVGKLHVKVRQGILFVDAPESEYEVDVYFWADGQYRHEPIDY